MELKGKKVLVVGLGKSGLAAALFLRRRGAQVTVSDLRSAQALSKEIPSLLEAGILVEAGGHGLLTFRRQDLIVVSPGVPLLTPELVQVRNLGLPIIGELELAARFLQGNVLAITGSNGKTTTTTLCGEIFKAGGLQTLVAGNIGIPVIETVDQSNAGTWSVLEVSSFQLETTESFHPRVAVILNITPDHLDRHGTFANYVAMKEKIFANQTGEDYLVLNGDDPVTQQAASRAKSQVLWFSRSKIVRRGTFLMNGMVMFRASEQASPDPGGSPGRHFAQGRAQYRECAGCRVRGLHCEYTGRGHCACGRVFPCGRASSRVCRCHPRRRLLQRFQSHKRRRHGESDCLVSQEIFT